jgi:DNA-binding transcriptional ArsR family regulator
MAKIKLDITKLEEVAGRLRSLAHPTRIAIISLLDDKGTLNVTEIYFKLHIEQTTASHHLNILKRAGVLVSKKEGKQKFYSLKTEAIALIADCLNKCAI